MVYKREGVWTSGRRLPIFLSVHLPHGAKCCNTTDTNVDKFGLKLLCAVADPHHVDSLFQFPLRVAREVFSLLISRLTGDT